MSEKEEIERITHYPHGMEDDDFGECVFYDDHMAVTGKLLMQVLGLKLENEAYQVHIKEQEDAKQ